MYILIIGGGKIGYYLTKTLLQANYSVGIVEQDEKRCMRLAEDFEITVINGDGTDIKVLREAAVNDAHYTVAVTGRDEVNLVICQLAKKYFQADLRDSAHYHLVINTALVKPGTIVELVKSLIEERKENRHDPSGS